MAGRQKTRDSENLPVRANQNTASKLVKSVCYDKSVGRPVEFMLHVLSGKSVADAANETGFAVNHGYRVMRKYRENAKFRQQVAEVSAYFPEWCISVTKLKAPRLANLDNKILDKFDSDIELAIRHPQALKQIKQTAGLLPSDEQPKTELTVSIEKMQMIVRNVLESPSDVIDIKQIADQGHEDE